MVPDAARAEAPPRPRAERVVLKPLGDVDAARLPAAARAAAAAAAKRTLRCGDVVTASGVSFVVRGTTPRGGAAVDADTTSLDFDFGADPAKLAVADVVFVLDTSWSMRRADLPPTRLGAVQRAVATALANAHDAVRRAAVVAFAAEPSVVAPFAAPPSVDLGAVEALAPRGPGEAAAALDHALDLLAHEGDPAHEHAVLLATDAAPPAALADAAARAGRLGVQVHVLDAGAPDPARWVRLAADTGGTYHDAHAGVTFRPALQALADRFGVPLAWRDPARADGEGGFEVVLRAMTEREVDEFPALPRRFRKDRR